jgi:hypothetical protein
MWRKRRADHAAAARGTRADHEERHRRVNGGRDFESFTKVDGSINGAFSAGRRTADTSYGLA